MTDTNLTAATKFTPTATLPADEPVRYDTAPAERRAEIDRAMAEIDLDDSASVLFFGSAAQESVTGVADEMLEGVRNKDTGAAGQTLNEMVATLRGLSIADLEPERKPGLLTRLFRGVAPIARKLQEYERVRSQVTLSALKSAAVHLGTLRQGRKSLILISEGMRGLGRD